MEFSATKSISVGLFRYTLSEEKITIAPPLPGLRLGAGPKGNLIRIGAGSGHYRDVLGVGTVRKQVPVPNGILVPAGKHSPALREIESASTASAGDSSCEDLLRQINESRSKPGLAMFVLFIGGFAAFLGLEKVPLIGSIPVVFVAFLLVRLWDAQRKTTVVMYDLDEDHELLLKNAHRAITSLGNAHRLWHVEAAGAVGSRDRKYQAGAGTLVGRKETGISFGAPKFIATNVPVARLPVGRQTIYFFPNFILVEEGLRLAAIDYERFDLHVTETNFIESDSVPRDAKVVGQTWRYVNKAGGPDRRFKDNPTLKIARYDEFHFRSSSGLNELVQVSRMGLGSALAVSLRSLATVRSNVATFAAKPMAATDYVALAAVLCAGIAGLWLPTRVHPRAADAPSPLEVERTTNRRAPASIPAKSTPLPENPPQAKPAQEHAPTSVVERKVQALKITAIVGGTRSKVMIDGTLYGVGDPVDRTIGILVHSLNAETATVTFIDLDGKLYTRSIK